MAGRVDFQRIRGGGGTRRPAEAKHNCQDKTHELVLSANDYHKHYARPRNCKKMALLPTQFRRHGKGCYRAHIGPPFAPFNVIVIAQETS